MSPIQDSPQQGYTDYQRIVNYDSGILVNGGSGATNAYGTVAIDVSRYAYVSGTLSVTTNLAVVKHAWYADEALTVPVGNRTYAIDPATTPSQQFHIPNLGPWYQATVSGFGANLIGCSLKLFASNRPVPIEAIPTEPTLLLIGGDSVASNGENDYRGVGYYSGPAKVWAYSDGGVLVTAQVLDTAGGYQSFWQVNVGATANVTDTIVVPHGSWFVKVHNFGASATDIYLGIVPSPSGAA